MSCFSRSAAVLAAAVAWHGALAAQQRPIHPLDPATLERIVPAPSGSIKIYEATFDRFAAAIQPIQYSIPYDLTFPVWNPFGDDGSVTLCSSTMNANVSSLDVTLSPYGMTITGKAAGTWCGLSFKDIGVTITADVGYDSTARIIWIATNNAIVSPKVGFAVPEWAQDWLDLPSSISVSLPSFSVGSSFAVPPIAFDSAPFMVQTPAGPRSLVLSGHNVSLIRQDGYIEIRGNAIIR